MKKTLIAFFLAVVFLGAPYTWAEEAAAPVSEPPAAAGPKPDWLTYKNQYTAEQSNITNPHRTAEEISIWSQQTAAEVLSLEAKGYKEKLADFKKYFLPQGWQLYAAYLKETKLINMVADEGYSVSTIVNTSPEIVNHGSADGSYHWIVKLPITISFYTVDGNGETKTGSSGKHLLFLDITRVETGGGDNGIVIANWRVDDMPKN